jgi:hypothetical protein
LPHLPSVLDVSPGGIETVGEDEVVVVVVVVGLLVVVVGGGVGVVVVVVWPGEPGVVVTLVGGLPG